METKQTTIKVCNTHCEHCGMERYGFAPHRTSCPRCDDRESQIARWISDPCQETIDAARRDGKTL